MYDSDLWQHVAVLRKLSAASNTTTDPTYDSGVPIIGTWETSTRTMPSPAGGRQTQVQHAFITAGQIVEVVDGVIFRTGRYATPTRDDLLFPPGADASVQNNGHQVLGVDVQFETEGSANQVRHLEILL